VLYIANPYGQGLSNGCGKNLRRTATTLTKKSHATTGYAHDPEVREVTLKMIIEQSDNLTEWTKFDGEMTRTIPIPDGKKFYLFALDK